MTKVTPIERTGAVTFKGGPVTLLGPELKIGDKAPEFTLYANDLQAVTLSDVLADNTRAALLIVVPSIDTSVCSLETRKFNTHVANLPTDKIATFTISVDLPFAQKRFTSAEKVANLSLLSAYRDPCFGINYGVSIKELGLLSRSVFLVDKDGIVRMALTVSEVAQEPDYDEVLSEATKLIGL